MEKRLKVLTLNVWGIAIPVFGSPDRVLRVTAIADKLSKSDYDVVCLQEVWSFHNFELIRERVQSVLPDSFYFHSGLVGSGVCIFTRGKIHFTMVHRYSLNGYPHHLHHGDWFGGKVCGLARVELDGLKVDVYGTHLHAEYDRENDLYLPHRVLQAFELSQFVNETTSGDVAVVMGDLNLEPSDMGFKLIMSNGYLSDAFIERSDKTQPRDADPNGLTCDVPSNSYTCEKQPHYEGGTRIDYILFRPSATHNVECKTCCTTLGRIPSKPTINYSDHLAVCATFLIKPSDATTGGAIQKQATEHMLDEGIKQMENGIIAAGGKGFWCGLLLGILIGAYIGSIVIEVAVETLLCTVVMLTVRFCSTLCIGFCVLYGMVGLQMEQKSLRAARDSMMILMTARNAETRQNA